MSSVNKVIILGRLGRDPESRFMPDGTAVTTMRVATTKYSKDQNGQRKEDTQWHRIVCFGRTAEIATEYLKKGHLAYFEGEIYTGKWQDKEGVDRYTTEIRANDLRLFPRSHNPGNEAAKSVDNQASSAPEPLDDDLPF